MIPHELLCLVQKRASLRGLCPKFNSGGCASEQSNVKGNMPSLSSDETQSGSADGSNGYRRHPLNSTGSTDDRSY